MELLHGADAEHLAMPVFTLPPTPRAPFAKPLSTTVRTPPVMPQRYAAPRPKPSALAESFWTFLGRAWFFVAGVTIGVLFAAALVAVAAHVGPKHRAPVAKNPPAVKNAPAAKNARAAKDARTSRLVIVGPAVATARAAAEVRDVPEAAPPAAAKPIVRRRTAVAPHKPRAARRAGKRDILGAAL